MILEAVEAELAARLRQAEQFYRLIETMTDPAAPVSEEVRCAKGLFFVQLYGLFEFVVSMCCQASIQHLNQCGLKIGELISNIQCLALDDKFQSLESSYGKRHWDRRWVLLHNDTMSNTINISTALLPIPSGNIREGQLRALAEAFGISSSLLPDATSIRYVNEIAEHRMAVSHGRSAPAEVGERFSVAELKERLNAVRAICEHIIQTFEGHLVSGAYKAPTAVVAPV